MRLARSAGLEEQASSMHDWRRPRFEWDEANEEHILRHDVYPEEAEQVFANDRPVIRRAGDRYEVMGRDDAGRYLFVVCVMRRDRVRVITARPMTRKEQRFYDRHR
jgi:uncharacterized DUF497 family protein